MSELGEFALIERYFRHDGDDAAVRLGIGDDAAIVRPREGFDLVLTVDMMVEGRHFLPGTDPARLGHKILAVNLSDLAAMGAAPRFALLAGAMPAADAQWLDAFSRGLFALAQAHGVTLIGGDTTRGPLNVCLTAIGEVPAGEGVQRSGARVGDDVWVSGEVGDAMLALATMQGRTALEGAALDTARGRLECPTPRVALGQALQGVATAMIDISDGLVGDLGHVLRSSGVGARLDLACIPRSTALAQKLAGPERDAALGWLLAGGDDYELCFTAAQERRAAVEHAGARTSTAVTRIGSVTGAASGLVVLDRGRVLAPLPRAFDHFASKDA